MIEKKLTVDEMVKVLQWCSGQDCNGCPLENIVGCINELLRKAANVLESLTTGNKCLLENNESRKQTNDAILKKLKAALEENTRLKKQVPHWRNPIFSKPKDGSKYVLAIVNGCATGKDGITCAFLGATELALYENKKWFLKGFDYSREIHIKYWMPLPELPKEETNA